MSSLIVSFPNAMLGKKRISDCAIVEKVTNRRSIENFVHRININVSHSLIVLQLIKAVEDMDMFFQAPDSEYRQVSTLYTEHWLNDARNPQTRWAGLPAFFSFYIFLKQMAIWLQTYIVEHKTTERPSRIHIVEQTGRVLQNKITKVVQFDRSSGMTKGHV